MLESDAGRDRVDGADVEADKLLRRRRPRDLPAGGFLFHQFSGHWDVAQRLERWSPTPMVKGSNPSVPAKPCLRQYGLLFVNSTVGTLVRTAGRTQEVRVRFPGGAQRAASITGDALNSYFRDGVQVPGGARPGSRATLAHQEERPTRNGQVTRSTRVGGSQGSGTDPAPDGRGKGQRLGGRRPAAHLRGCGSVVIHSTRSWRNWRRTRLRSVASEHEGSNPSERT